MSMKAPNSQATTEKIFTRQKGSNQEGDYKINGN
jgi:hypothetical protein